MNIEEIKARVQRRYDRQISILESLPNTIEFDGMDDIRMQLPNATYEENVETLHTLRQNCGNYKLIAYYACGTLLAVIYSFGDFQIIMYYTDRDSALDTISKGKCRIVVNEETRKTEDVVCELESELAV